jgi:glycosyltransferase involved in cell wall biosynthesis
MVGSAGLPVEEVITNGVEGVLVPMDDPHRLAERILALLHRPDLRDEFGRRARAKALQWDQSQTLPRLHDLIVQTAGV